MGLDVQIITGPPTSKVSKTKAEAKLRSHPAFPKGASFELSEVEGRWVAAIAKVAGPDDAPPFGGPSEGPAEAEEAPKLPEGPEDSGDESEEKPEKSEDKGEDKGEKGGLEAQVAHLTELLTKVVDALGLGEPEGSPVPDEIPHEGPPAPPPGVAPDGKTHTVHERSMKPGETPPGATPVGAPAFAKVDDSHPWKGVLGKKRTFTLEEPIGDQKLSDVRQEILALANGTGYEIRQLTEGQLDGQRTAKVLMQKV